MQVGLLGEKRVQAYLVSNGYTVITSNYGCPYGEIDIICLKNGTLIFVEVKTRTTDTYGQPYEAVKPFKYFKMRKAAGLFMTSCKIQFETVRFDVVSLRLSSSKQIVSLRHFKNIYM